jgi:hypothetical protein
MNLFSTIEGAVQKAEAVPPDTAVNADASQARRCPRSGPPATFVR